MEKATQFDKLYYSISEVAEMMEVNSSLIRFWEKEFSAFVKPKKNRNGKRMFTAADIEILKNIYFLTKEKGYTLTGARNYLNAGKKNLDKNIYLSESLKNIKGFLLDLRNQLND
ncbi:MAG: MerR family transcriptional regulator [Bacteroidetes bacterium]|jgi:DNA-binding transcriptional MerR regulator|nr:MerR family transcriptional regulator [Bacteroidota bacterium]MBT3935891.1 MerR family transcriptional regulator [Bacteroidota bacterium]MBT4339064.1 MerR family transcriptional regulator [Bacteroidota bacterium]MBT4969663.1 MerR family transcriptional regulator [Bacteroidota bacterium]MBT5991132.1 MerR family transcriptional regulator [Bacteroidota bacterium]